MDLEECHNKEVSCDYCVLDSEHRAGYNFGNTPVFLSDLTLLSKLSVKSIMVDRNFDMIFNSNVSRNHTMVIICF